MMAMEQEQGALFHSTPSFTLESLQSESISPRPSSCRLELDHDDATTNHTCHEHDNVIFSANISFSTKSAVAFWRPRWIYGSTFVWIAWVGGRFLAPFLEHEAQLSAQSIGVCLGLQAAISTVGGSYGGAWADARERRRVGGRTHVMAIGIVLGTLWFELHGILPLMPWTLPNALVPILLQCAFAMSTSLVYSVMDGITLDFLENLDASSSSHYSQGKAGYGPERLWGAVTWAVANVIASLLLDSYGFRCLYPLGILAAAGVITTLYLYQRAQVAHARHLSKKQSDHDSLMTQSQDTFAAPVISWKELCKPLYSTGYALAFVLFIVCLASGQAVVDSLIFLYFEFLGSSYVLMGGTVVLTVAFEIPIFHWAPYMLERWGAHAIMILAGLAYMTRVLVYSILPQGHVVYVLWWEPLHGVTYACSQSAIVHFVAHAMPPGYEASGQGLVCLFRGMGSMLGLWLGGWAVDTIGPRYMYRASAGVVAFGMVIFGIAACRMNELLPQSMQRNARHQRIPQDESSIEISETFTQSEDSLS
jgi:hypothetical protein